MKAFTVIFTLLLVMLTAKIVKDSPLAQSKVTELSVPRDIVMPLMAYQPNSPLKLEYVQLNKSTDGGTPYPVIRLRNASSKTIKTYNIAYLIPGGAGGAWASKGERILPGELIPERESPASTNDVQLTENTKKIQKLDGPMQAAWIFMVIRVEFEDGTVFEDEKTYTALKDYLESLSIKK